MVTVAEDIVLEVIVLDQDPIIQAERLKQPQRQTRGVIIFHGTIIITAVIATSTTTTAIPFNHL